jgi:transcription initiation factor IIE alpha subunit
MWPLPREEFQQQKFAQFRCDLCGAQVDRVEINANRSE